MPRPDAAVDEVGVVCPGGLGGDRKRGRVRQPVSSAHDERVEGVVRTQEHLLVEPCGAFRGLGVGVRRTRGARGARLGLRLVIRADESDHEQPTGHALGRLREVRAAAALHVAQLHRLANHETQDPVLDLRRLDVVEPVPADVGMVLPQVVDERLAETWLELLHGSSRRPPREGGASGRGARPASVSLRCPKARRICGEANGSSHRSGLRRGGGR